MKPLLRHQSDALAFLRRRNWQGALFMEPGLGKSRVGLEVARSARRTLILAPPNPAELVWPEQHQEWANDIDFQLVRGTPQTRARILFEEKPTIAVLNTTMLHWLYDEVRERRRMPYDVCLLDESTSVKTSDSIAFRALRGLRPAFDAVIPMTGTPAENSLTDIWGQLWFVDQGIALGNKIGIFRERYCKPVIRENYVTWVVSRAEELRVHAAPLCFVRRATDCLDMPRLIFRDVEFKLAPEERAFYERVKKHVVPLPVPVPLENAGVTLDKLRQVTSGFVYDEDKVAHRVGRSKAKAMVEALDESFGRPVLIGFWYQHSKHIIKEVLKYDVPTIDRYASKSEKRELLAKWRAGKLPHLLGQIRSVAYGTNMQSPEASVLFYDLPWSHGQHWQFIRRVWRQGQKTKVVVRRLIARGTVDGYVAGVLRRKELAEDDLMETILNEELI